uniref:M23 family metallopeptidase n=1 Tax=Kribbella catacumbae TaxID=460086 RepID=UPI00037B1A72
PALAAAQPTPGPTQSALTAAQPALPPPQTAAVWPLNPRPEIVRGFEPPPKPWLPGHRGLDLRGSPGQQVRSATPGKVTYAAALAGRGVIVITNGPLRTTYEPVIATIRVGTTVIPGTPLGHLSAAGSHCAPTTCLHWGLLQATTYLNPLALLPQRPIRLLPTTPAPTNTRSAPAGPLSTHPAGPPLTPANAPPSTRLVANASPRGGLASGVIVGLAAAATLIGSLLIRRH